MPRLKQKIKSQLLVDSNAENSARNASQNKAPHYCLKSAVHDRELEMFSDCST